MTRPDHPEKEQGGLDGERRAGSKVGRKHFLTAGLGLLGAAAATRAGLLDEAHAARPDAPVGDGLRPAQVRRLRHRR